jgi:hypothetical protein
MSGAINAPVSTLAKRPSTIQSGARRLYLVVAAVFGIEGGIMVGLHFLTPLPDLLEGIGDATLLTLALLPLLYCNFVRPLVSQERRIRAFIENALDIAWTSEHADKDPGCRFCESQWCCATDRAPRMDIKICLMM